MPHAQPRQSASPVCNNGAHDSTPPSPPPENVFTWPVRIYWEDTDAGGIVFYANYLKFFERARTEWLRAKGVEQRQLQQDLGCIFVVSDVQIKYLRSARLDDQLLVTAHLSELGRSSFTIQQEARLVSKDAVARRAVHGLGARRLGPRPDVQAGAHTARAAEGACRAENPCDVAGCRIHAVSASPALPRVNPPR